MPYPRWLVREDPTKTPPLQPTLWGHLLLGGALSIGGILLYGTSVFSINHLSSSWHVCPISSDATRPGPKDAPPSLPSPSPSSSQLVQGSGHLPDLKTIFDHINAVSKTILPEQKERLKSQVVQLQRAQATACEIGIFFFANRNAALTVATAAGILAISSLAFVSKEGWEDSNRLVINIGVTSGLILFATWTFGQLYGQGVNYENQKAKVILASNALNLIASAMANRTVLLPEMKPETPGKVMELSLVNAKEATLLIQYIDKQIEIINAINFTGDSSFAEQSAQRIYGILKQADPSPTVSR